MRLFLFGTLMDRDLLALVLGRGLDDLTWRPAMKRGVRRNCVRGEGYPTLVPCAGEAVDGMVVDGLAGTDLQRVLFFTEEEHRLEPIDVDTDEGSESVNVFVPKGRRADSGEPWSLRTWQILEKPMVLLAAEEHMSLFGRMSAREAATRWGDFKEQAFRQYLGQMASAARRMTAE